MEEKEILHTTIKRTDLPRKHGLLNCLKQMQQLTNNSYNSLIFDWILIYILLRI